MSLSDISGIFWVNFDWTYSISKKRNLKDVGDDLLELIIAVASGEKTTKAAQLLQLLEL